jgi:hypothetical protein
MYLIKPDAPIIIDYSYMNKTSAIFSTDRVINPRWPIQYKFNSLGYRTKEIETLDNDFILSYGCSYTEGVGLNVEQIWIDQVAKTLGIDYYNAAKQATGIDFVYLNNLMWINSQLPKPKIVIIQWPQKHRKSFGFKENYGIRFEDMSETATHDGRWWGKRYITDTGDLSLNVWSWFEAVNNSWKMLGVPVLNFTWDDDLEEELQRSRYKIWHIHPLARDKARDGQHDGPKFHKETAEIISSLLKLPDFTHKV